MQALHDVVKAGYVRYIGMSSCHAWQCTWSNHISGIGYSRQFFWLFCQSTRCRVCHIYHPSRWIFTELTDFIDYAINNKLTPFISMQNHYSLVYREEEREMMPTLKVRARVLYT